MMKHSVIFLTWSIVIILANASGLDDFSNNLASDLGPLLSLFGESVTRQYLSESTKFIDYFIFAMAPIGIISTITAVIRVCGSPNLKAFIGRAQEGEGTVEVELCTSTSADICELFDKGGITRVFGRPDIIELVHIPDAPTDSQLNLQLFTRYLENLEKDLPHNPWFKIPNWKEGDWKFAPKPNISLNVGMKRLPDAVLYIVAVIGFILQFGIIVFAGIAFWLLDWNISKDSTEASRNYAPGIFIAGTVALCLGIWSCAALIGQTTEEKEYGRKVKNNSSTIYWLQPGPQIVGDQTFNSFGYSDEKMPLQTWISSRKIPQKKHFETIIAVLLVLFGYIAQFIGLRGLDAWVSIAQLGITLVMSLLRGALRMRRLDESKNLIRSPFDNTNDSAEWSNLVAGHELDWLAVEVSKKTSEKGTSNKYVSNEGLEKVAVEKDFRNNYTWHITGQHENAEIKAHTAEQHKGAGTSIAQTTGQQKDTKTSEDKTHESLMFRNRARLSQLTGHYSINTMEPNEYQTWKDERVKVRIKAKRLGAAISQAAAILLHDATIKETIYLKVKVMVANIDPLLTEKEFWPITSSQSQETVSITVNPPTGSGHVDWRVDSSQLEAVLGLWLWSMSSRVWRTDDSISSLAARRNTRMFKIVSARYGSQGWDDSIEGDMNLWQGSRSLQYGKLSLKVCKDRKYSLADIWETTEEDITNNIKKIERVTENLVNSKIGPSKLQNICGWNVVYDLLQRNMFREDYINIQGLWVDFSEHPLLDVCAQDLFVILLRSLQSLKFRTINQGSIIESGGNIRIENPVIADLAKFFTKNALGTYSDAICCIIPLLRSQLYSHNDNLLSMIIQAATEYRLNEELERAERVLRFACKSYQRQTPGDMSEGSYFAIALQELGEFYRISFPNPRWSFVNRGIAWMIHEFGEDNPVSSRYRDILGKLLHNNDKFVEDPVKRFVRAIRKSERVDALFYLCFTKSDDFDTPELKRCLPLAAQIGWPEVISTFLRMQVNPDTIDANRRTSASYCAELGHKWSLQQLIGIGANLSLADQNDLTPLIYAVRNEREDIVNMLLRTEQVDCNRPMYNNRNALWFAVEQNSIIMSSLLDNGGDIEGADAYGVTPLLLAAKRGHKDAVELLIKRGAVVDTQDHSQVTPLLWATWRGHADIIPLLVKALEKPGVMTQLVQDQVSEAERLLGPGAHVSPLRNHSDGFCSTLDIRPPTRQSQTDILHIAFRPPHSKPPRIMLGINEINIKWKVPRHVQWQASKVTSSKLELKRTNFNFNLPSKRTHVSNKSDSSNYFDDSDDSDSSGGYDGSDLYAASSSVVWLELGSNEEGFQVGKSSYSKNIDEEICFEKQYDETPSVIVWYTSFEFLGTGRCSFHARVKDIGPSGFKLLHFEQKAAVDWLAFPTESKRIKSGHGTHTEALRDYNEECSNEQREHKIDFAEPFERTPRVFIAINGIEIESVQSMNIKVRISKQSAKSFSWACEAPDGACIDVDWIAFG